MDTIRLAYAPPGLVQPIGSVRLWKFAAIPVFVIIATVIDLVIRCAVARVIVHTSSETPFTWSESVVYRYHSVEYKVQAAYGCALFLLLLLRCLTLRLGPRTEVSGIDVQRWARRAMRWNALAIVAVLIALLAPVPGRINSLPSL